MVPGLTKIGDTVNHLREVLGDNAYESLASAGAANTLADIAAYAFDQIAQARAELTTASKQKRVGHPPPPGDAEVFRQFGVPQ